MSSIENGIIYILNSINRKIVSDLKLSVRPKIILMHKTDESYNHAWGYYHEGVIGIKLKKKNGKYLPIEEIVDTFLHELAHATDEDASGKHTKGWVDRYRQYLEYVRGTYNIKLR